MEEAEQKKKGKGGKKENNAKKESAVQYESDFEFQMTYFGLIGTTFDVFIVVENQEKLVKEFKQLK